MPHKILCLNFRLFRYNIKSCLLLVSDMAYSQLRQHLLDVSSGVKFLPKQKRIKMNKQLDTSNWNKKYPVWKLIQYHFQLNLWRKPDSGNTSYKHLKFRRSKRQLKAVIAAPKSSSLSNSVKWALERLNVESVQTYTTDETLQLCLPGLHR